LEGPLGGQSSGVKSCGEAVRRREKGHNLKETTPTSMTVRYGREAGGRWSWEEGRGKGADHNRRAFWKKYNRICLTCGFC